VELAAAAATVSDTAVRSFGYSIETVVAEVADTDIAAIDAADLPTTFDDNLPRCYLLYSTRSCRTKSLFHYSPCDDCSSVQRLLLPPEHFPTERTHMIVDWTVLRLNVGHDLELNYCSLMFLLLSSGRFPEWSRLALLADLEAGHCCLMRCFGHYTEDGRLSGDSSTWLFGS
jgi:hypothetical protein